ncbi:hypothetical protein DSECCO2_494530 [anaerobic digester metagenome]
MLDRGPVRGRDHLHAALGQPGRGQGPAQEAAQDLVGVEGLGTAAQDDAVAGLEAEDGRVDGHVGAGLVDDGDDAQGDAHAAHEQAVGPLDHALDLAHRVGQPGHVPAGRGHGVDALVGDAQAVDAGFVEACLPRRVEVLGVGLEYLAAGLFEEVRQGRQGLVALKSRGRGQCPRRGLRRGGQLAHLRFQIHPSLLSAGVQSRNVKTVIIKDYTNAARQARNGRAADRLFAKNSLISIYFSLQHSL